jgi:hypothetical protein
VRPLEGISEDVTYTGHWLVFPRAKRYSKSIVAFVEWLAKELKMNIDYALVDAETRTR